MASAAGSYKYFGFGPRNLDRIDENLWIGNLAAATNLNVIRNIRVSRILTVDAFPLPQKILDSGIETMCIPVTDLPNEDLISYFEEAYDFIENGLQEGAVLVHCYQGVSRSVTVVLAYLMKKYRWTFEQAFEMTKSKRKIIYPNPGFTGQLKLYEVMGFRIDESHKQYRMFRLYLAGDRIRTSKVLPEDFADVVKPDPAVSCDLPDPRVYRCKRCRRILTTETNMIPHFPSERYMWRDRRFGSEYRWKNYCDRMYFSEPMAWMTNVTNKLSGKLYCPNPRCQLKLGSYSWNMGCFCPCGAKVTPGFYLVPSKVDREDLVQIVHIII